MKKGDKVFYCPDETYAVNRNVNGDMPWVVGRRLHNYDARLPPGCNKEEVTRNGETFTVEVLTGNRLTEYIDFLRRHPNPADERRNFILLRPNCLWNAVVKEVNGDGTLNIATECHNTGVTLHIDGVRVSDAKHPHTCHAAPGPTAATPAAGDEGSSKR